MLDPDTILQDRYLIVRRIGQGGMGAVYMAKDQRLGSLVALKETFFTDERMRRAFEREARLLASLRHPALPVVSDHFPENAGQFLVMQYIPGDDLATLLSQRGSAFPPGQVLSWADQLLDALDYLHTQQPPIIHRDIKPHNLKLTARGNVVLLDFGLAKGAADLSELSAGQSIFGFTRRYAPLEQIQGAGTDARSDLYSLGATLYHLMTGETPVDAEVRQKAAAGRQADPARRANEINPQVPRAVADVLHKAMRLSRDERYTSAAAMRRALRDAAQAEQSTGIELAPQSVPHPLPIYPPARTPRSAWHRRWLIVGVIALLAAGVVWGVLDRGGEKLTLIGNYKVRPGVISSVAFSPDGQTLAASSYNGTISLWDAQTGELKQSLTWNSQPDAVVAFSPEGLTKVVAVAFSPDGQTLAASSVDKAVSLWDAQTGTPRKPLTGHDNAVWGIAFSPDGTLASGSYDNTIKLWDVQTGALKRELGGKKPRSALAFSPDGQTLASGSDQNTVLLWNVQTGEVQELKVDELAGRKVHNKWEFMRSLAFSPDERTLAIGGDDQMIRLWDVVSKKPKGEPLIGHAGSVWTLAFSPDGAILASGGDDRMIRLWDVQTGALRQKPLMGHRGRVASLAFSPDGQTLASGSYDSTAKLWPVSGAR